MLSVTRDLGEETGLEAGVAVGGLLTIPKSGLSWLRSPDLQANFKVQGRRMDWGRVQA